MSAWKELAKQQELNNLLLAKALGTLTPSDSNTPVLNDNIPYLDANVNLSSKNMPVQYSAKLNNNESIFNNMGTFNSEDYSDNKSFNTSSNEESLSKADLSLLSKYLRTKLTNIGESNMHMTDNDIYNFENSLGIVNRGDTPPASFQDFNLKPEILKAIYDLGFHRPSRIQELTLPIMLTKNEHGHGSDVIAQSQSGTGKTAAFVVAMLSVIDTTRDIPQALCLAPTFELALQIYDVIKDLGKFIPNLKIGKAIKGASRGFSLNHANSTSLENPYPLQESHVIIGTPGTVYNMMKSRSLPCKDIKIFVLDEADVMLDIQGLSDTSIRINKLLSAQSCQRLLFSATYDDEVMSFAKSILPKAKVFSLEPPKLVLTNISQFCVLCHTFEDKLQILVAIYGALAIGQCIVFCDTKKQAAFLVRYLRESAGFPVTLLSSELAIEERAGVIRDFREGKERLIVATNVLARGIDIEQVNLVLNFDLPITATNYHSLGYSSNQINAQQGAYNSQPSRFDSQKSQPKRADVETYLHRIGRCGRFGKKGLAINLIEPSQLPLLEQIDAALQITIPVIDKDKILLADDGEEIQKLLA